MKLNIFISFCFLFPLITFSQSPNFKWAGKQGGNSTEIINSVASDTAGNIYTAGYYNGTCDFDPGPGTYLLNHSGYENLFVSKLDSSGNFLWAKSFDGPSSSANASSTTIRQSIATDKFGNVFISGTCSDTVDFDPGVGVFKLGSGVFILKLDPLGNFIWAKGLKGSGVGSITLDKLGNIYTTGEFGGTSDFDPGIGVFNLISAGSSGVDAFISKLDINGNFVWAKKISGSTNNEVGTSITVDATGNVITTGYFDGLVDFNPGIATYTLASTANNFEAYISKLDANGNFVWAKKIGGSSGSYGSSISVDIYGNIYTVGTFEGTGDFNPSTPVYTLTSNGYLDAFISKLDSLGNFVWAKSFGGAFSNDNVNQLGMDAAGYLYLTGAFQSTTDFDPSPSSYTITAIGNVDCFISKFNQAGAFLWVNTFGATANTCASNSIAFEPLGNMYAAGYFNGTVDFDSSIGTYTVQSGYAPDGFITKLYDCSIPPKPLNNTSSANATICNNSTTTLTVLSYGTVKWYSTATSTVVLGSGFNFITPILSGGTYTYYAEASTCAISASRTAVTVTVMLTPSITITGTNTLCVGSSVLLTANGVTTYTWNTGATTPSINITPTITTTYSVIGTNTLGCSNTQTVTITVDNTCAYVWPGDANNDGIADNLDVLELGLHYTQSDVPRAATSNNWQAYFANNWVGTITNGSNLNHSDCNGDGIINDDDTLAIYTNYNLTHAFKPAQTTTNPAVTIVPDQSSVAKGTWGTSSVYLGDATTAINTINGVAFTVNYDNTLLETDSVWIEYPTSFINAGNQNLKFRKRDFSNGKLYTVTTHTISGNVNGYGKIAILHYKIKSSLTTDNVLNLSIAQANQSDSSGVITPLTAGSATLMALGTSIATNLNALTNGNYISLHPNPTNGVLTINSTSELQKIDVVAITGQLLLSEVPSSTSHVLHLDHLANGVYFVNLYKNNRIVKREKIILNK
jgi:hypothetical protein